MPLVILLPPNSHKDQNLPRRKIWGDRLYRDRLHRDRLYSELWEAARRGEGEGRASKTKMHIVMKRSMCRVPYI